MSTDTKRSAAARLSRLLVNLVLVSVTLVATAYLVPSLLGYDRYVITGGSMGDTFQRGSIVFAETVPVKDLGIGDVITYDPPPEAHTEGMVTHRITAVRGQADGGRVFRTQGDANPDPDPWRFTLDQGTQARVQYFHLPLFGYVPAALGKREIRMLLIGLPALLVAFGIMARLWREAGEEAALEGAR